MRYAMIDKEKGEAIGLRSDLHRVVGGKMVINENELKFAEDKELAARSLGGELVSYSEIINTINEISK